MIHLVYRVLLISSFIDQRMKFPRDMHVHYVDLSTWFNPFAKVHCGQVAAISGDARRALEICRRAAELADYRQKQLPQPMVESLHLNKGM